MPKQIEKGAAANDAPQAPNPSLAKAQPFVYRCDSKTASHGPRLRLIHDNGLKAQVLEKAATEVRLEPSTFSLWCFRLAQHVNRGTYGFTQVWETLKAAALDAGLCENRIDRVLYSGFGDAMKSPAPPMPLTVLRGGVH